MSNMQKPLTQERLKQMLHYDPETGVFTWRIHKATHNGIGSVAGYINSCGYPSIGIDYRHWLSHRLAFLYMTGEMPAIIDHINGKPADNRWCNLRASSHQLNQANRKRPSSNTTGFKGVHLLKRVVAKGGSKPYQVRIRVKGRNVFLGCYATPEEAHEAYKVAAVQHNGEHARFE